MKTVMINWDYQKEKLKKRYSKLTDSDLNFEKGKMEDMLVKLQQKTGKSRHELYEIISGL